MKSYRKELWFEVPTRRAFVKITSDVQRCIDASGVSEGPLLVHTRQIELRMYQI